MANTVNIAQFQSIPTDIQIVEGNDAMVSENVTSSATSAQSTALKPTTRIVRIATDTTVRVAFGSNPTATSTDMRVLADTAEYFGVQPGTKVAVINE